MYSNILTINDQRFIEKTGLHELTRSWRLSLIHPCAPGRIFLFQHGQRNAHRYSFIPKKKDVKVRVVGQPDTVSDTSIQIICNLA
ncbi:hypothetical protein SAMN04487964_1128 [Marinobacterium sediminicola]|uniref:Uncharacterized protein n=1 Tax=Marinobacterium sediminicola TaxID=518898 RepID=A0ABY1S209_9GAMM|nr:hypothetical protein SAMN04487964_1128 [Marinobacterium sediminicola]